MFRTFRPAVVQLSTYTGKSGTATGLKPTSFSSPARIVRGQSSAPSAEYSDLEAYKFSEREAERVRGGEERMGYVWVAWREDVRERRYEGEAFVEVVDGNGKGGG
jgi:hypothetical protein